MNCKCQGKHRSATITKLDTGFVVETSDGKARAAESLPEAEGIVEAFFDSPEPETPDAMAIVQNVLPQLAPLFGIKQ